MSDLEISPDLKVHTNFTVSRHPGLVIVWKVGGSKLHLMRIGGPNGSYKMKTKTSASYKQSKGAIRGAERWFDILDKVYVPELPDAWK